MLIENVFEGVDYELARQSFLVFNGSFGSWFGVG